MGIEEDRDEFESHKLELNFKYNVRSHIRDLVLEILDSTPRIAKDDLRPEPQYVSILAQELVGSSCHLHGIHTPGVENCVAGAKQDADSWGKERGQ